MRRVSFLLLAVLLPACTSQPAPRAPYVVRTATTPRATVPPAPAPAPAPATPATPQSSLRPSVPDALHPCAENLQTLAGLVLQYYLIHKDLPHDLDALLKLPSFPDPTPTLNCPTSHERYVYNPNGPILAGAGRLIIYDASPVHAGTRWGVAIQQPNQDHPMTARVVTVPESVFAHR